MPPRSARLRAGSDAEAVCPPEESRGRSRGDILFLVPFALHRLSACRGQCRSFRQNGLGLMSNRLCSVFGMFSWSMGLTFCSASLLLFYGRTSRSSCDVRPSPRCTSRSRVCPTGCGRQTGFFRYAFATWPAFTHCLRMLTFLVRRKQICEGRLCTATS